MTAELVHGDRSVITEYVVALVELHDLGGIGARGSVVAQELVIGEGTVVQAYSAQAHIGVLAGDVNRLRCHLQERVCLSVAHRPRADTVDVELQEAITRLRLNDEGDAIELARGKLGNHDST